MLLILIMWVQGQQQLQQVELEDPSEEAMHLYQAVVMEAFKATWISILG
jgi:hypothetical protein